MILGMEPNIRSIGPLIRELWLSLNLAVKEQNERVYKYGRQCNFFCRQCKSFCPSWISCIEAWNTTLKKIFWALPDLRNIQNYNTLLSILLPRQVQYLA